MFERLDKAHRPPPSARWQSGGRRPFVRGGQGPEPAAFPAGTAARLAGADLDSSRQERALLGALIERPFLLHAVFDDLDKLKITNPELRLLEVALHDFLSEPPSMEPAAGEVIDEGTLEERQLAQHLQRSGLDGVAQSARTKARELFREKENDAWLQRWRRIFDRLIARKAAAAHLLEAEQAFAAQSTEENWLHFLAARQHHQAVAASETG
jgi:DNA primase